ncbi:hypothetical protein Gpo141_00008429 [Globisporangium polare]
MKRMHDAAQASATATASAERDAKKAKPPEEQTQAASQVAKKNVIELDETIDVEAFFKQDCDGAAQRLLEQTKARCADLRREFEQSKQTILKGLLAEKENLPNDQEAASTPDAYDVNIKCVAGPYKGHAYALQLDSQKHRSCLIGRSTGRKFRAPNGLSMPKDAELSTTHAQLRLEPDGRVFFTDLDSTNGSFINDESVEPHEPQLLSTTAPSKVYVGGSDLLITFTRRP